MYMMLNEFGEFLHRSLDLVGLPWKYEEGYPAHIKLGRGGEYKDTYLIVDDYDTEYNDNEEEYMENLTLKVRSQLDYAYYQDCVTFKFRWRNINKPEDLKEIIEDMILLLNKVR